jgi:hypothetical protein
MTAPSDTVNIAVVGIGGMGSSNTRAVASQNIVAICDVDLAYAEPAIERLIKSPGQGGGRGRDTGEAVRGRARVFYPSDAHAPKQAVGKPSRVHKIVIKVAV